MAYEESSDSIGILNGFFCERETEHTQQARWNLLGTFWVM